MEKHDHLFDVIGIGLGPFNLGLAALMNPLLRSDTHSDTESSDFRVAFFEQRPQFSWHEGIMLEGTSLQVPFLADLVTMADPTSPYSYLNYLHHQGRLYHFYFYEKFHIPREEFNHYGQWVAKQLPFCHFHQKVEKVEREGEIFRVEVQDLGARKKKIFWTRDLVLGIGQTPWTPECFQPYLNLNLNSVTHSANFNFKKAEITEKTSVAVIGSGQSAAECFLELLRTVDRRKTHLFWVTSSPGFFPMEYSKLGLEHFSPDYTQYFFHLPSPTKKKLLKEQNLLYKGIDFETIEEIYDTLYEATVGGREPFFSLLPMRRVIEVQRPFSPDNGVTNRFQLTLEHTQEKTELLLEVEAVVLGTGYHQPWPQFMNPLRSLLSFDSLGDLEISENYQLQFQALDFFKGRIFIQNGEKHTHGVGAPDLGLGAFRNSKILAEIWGKECYPLRQKNIFQSFSTWSSSCMTWQTSQTGEKKRESGLNGISLSK